MIKTNERNTSTYESMIFNWILSTKQKKSIQSRCADVYGTFSFTKEKKRRHFLRRSIMLLQIQRDIIRVYLRNT